MLIAIAALNALDSFNKFLCTPAGQQLASANNEVIATILRHLGVKVGQGESDVSKP